MAGTSTIAIKEPVARMVRAERDIVALGVAVAAIILFVGTGGSVLPKIVRAWLGTGFSPDVALTNALLLNIALIIFGWRRYAEVKGEVERRRQAEEEAKLLAQTDPLTGLINRRILPETIASLIREARTSGRDVAVLMLDVDNFKQINDLNGHMIGDRLLVEISGRMKELLPEGSILARIGGDEFACLVAFDERRQDKIDQLATRMLDVVARTTEIEGLVIEFSVSIGIARTERENASASPDDIVSASPEDLVQAMLHHADIALHNAKKSLQSRYFWFEAPMESELRFRNELETGIRRGIPKGEFVPYYERQVDLETGELVGFEMLARWNSPQLGIVSPDIFIPIAEEIGVIGELSESLIRQAFEDAKGWDPKITLSINISPIQLRDPWFSQKLLRLLVESGFPSHRLDVEITESCLHENIGVVRSVITSLKNQGIRISLDDFGTGYSSLDQLRSLPFDRLKIDRSFISELAKDGANSKIVEAIVSLGRGLDLPVTVEGIENGAILEVLRKMGKLNGQGYLYGRPEDSAAILDRIARERDPTGPDSADGVDNGESEAEFESDEDPARKAAS